MDMPQRFGRVAFITAFAVSFSAAQWVQTASSPKGSGITDLVVKQSNGYLFATTGSFNWPNADTGGVHRSTDGGNTWTRVFPAFIARTIAVKENGIIFASVWDLPTRNEGIYYSTNDGATWTPTLILGTADNIFCIAFDPTSPNIVYAGNRFGILRNVNGGTSGTWELNRIAIGNLWTRDIVVVPQITSRVFAAIQNIDNPAANGVYYTNSLTGGWTRSGGIATGDTIVSLIAVRDTSVASAPGFVDVVFAGASNGKIYSASVGIGLMVYALIYSATGNPEIAGYWGFVLGFRVYLQAVAYERNLGGGGGVLQSIGSGGTWQPWSDYNQGLPAGRQMSAITGLYTSAVATIWCGAFLNQNNGAPVYSRTVTTTDVQQSSTEIPKAFSVHQNYPNPFNPSTKIVYRVKSRESISLRVFDVLGREVATLVDEVKEPGEYPVTLDASHLSSGVYFYRLQIGQFMETRKLVLLR